MGSNRIRDFIGDVLLSRIIKKEYSILEIGSGSGEHEDLKKKMPQPLILNLENVPGKYYLS